MKTNKLKIGYMNFRMTRTQLGTDQIINDGFEKEIPDQSGVYISAQTYLMVLELSKSYEEFFKFDNFELETNFVVADSSGEITMDFRKKEIRDDHINFDFTAFALKTEWPLKVNLELKIIKKSTGEVFSPRYEFELGSVQRDLLGFAQNRELHRELPIELPTTVPI